MPDTDKRLHRRFGGCGRRPWIVLATGADSEQAEAKEGKEGFHALDSIFNAPGVKLKAAGNFPFGGDMG
jgi:hypothetical protein